MGTSDRRVARALALLVALAAAGARAANTAGDGLPQISAGSSGQFVDAPSGRGEAELFRFHSRIGPALAALAPEESLLVSDWPVAPGIRRTVVLTRHEVYAPGARIFRADGQKMTELPRSRLVFLWGNDVDGRDRVFVSVDPDSGTMKGLSSTFEGFNEIAPRLDDREGRYLIARAEDLIGGPPPRWSCGQESSPATAYGTAARQPFGRAAALITSLHTATVAFDTDNELLSQKFGDDTTSATNYIASLVASINVMYERDLLLRLLQGFTVLRVSSAADPYNQTGSPASVAELSEFGSYWSASYGSVPRALAAMLSGKSSSDNSASGIAWYAPTPLCSPNLGYSFSQVFKITYLSGDTLIVGHEIGHNLTSPHTHCYSNSPLPAPDHCWNQEACYTGSTGCPSPQTINGLTGVTGTIMSYCHLLAGCGTSFVFHPRTVNEFAGPTIQSAVGTCVFPLYTGPTVSSISPNSGSTAGGTPVTISGSGFQSGATVSIGGVAATGVGVANANTITASTGAHATGTFDVVVTNPDTQSGALPEAFFYAPPPAGVRFYTLAPCRVMDTRGGAPLGGPALVPSARRTVTVAGVCGIPVDAASISVNLAVVAGAGGHLTLFPGNGVDPGSSNINFSAGQVRANNAILRLATDGSGTLAIRNGSAGSNEFILDVNGFFR